ncbi:MAG: hypothetical protein GX639_19350 [Fibrobacter sp.]|nr:hypothetical protein [Fibrobacter sp.]
MKVQGFGQLLHQVNAKQNSQLKSKMVSSAKAAASPDSFVQSASSDDRELFLQAIKNRVKSGFYSSAAVAEDLSHGFAKILDESV